MPTLDEQLVLAISADITNLRRAVTEMGGVVKKLAGDQSKYFDAIGGSANSSADKVVAASKRQAAGVTAEARKSAAAVADAHTRAAANAANSARNLTFQINDVMSGLASGGGMRAVAQQFGQIAQVFASGGGAGSGFLAVMRAMVSSGNLVTIALIAASAAATYFFSNMEDGAEKTQEKIDKMASAIEGIANKLKVLTPESSKALLEFTFTINSEKMIKETEDAIKQINDRIKAQTGPDTLLKKINKVEAALSFDQVDSAKLQQSFDAINEALERNQPAIVETTALYDKLLNLEFKNHQSGAGALALEVKALLVDMKKGWDVAQRLRELMDALRNATAETVDEAVNYNKAMQTLNSLGVQSLDASEQAARALADAIANAVGNAKGLVDAFAAAADASSRIGLQGLTDLAGLTSNTDDFGRAVADFETGGRNIKNTAGISTAGGPWQLLDDTFVDALRKAIPDLKNANRDFILAQRGNIDIEKAAFDQFTKDNEAYLTTHGKQINDANKFLLHLFGAGGFETIMRHPTDRAENFLSPAQLAGQPWSRGKTGLQIQSWAENEIQRRAAKTRGQDARDTVEADKEDLAIQGKITDAFNEKKASEVERLKLAELTRDLEKKAAEEHRTVSEADLANARETAKIAGEAAGREQGFEDAESVQARIQALADENAQLLEKVRLLGLTTEAVIASLDPEERRKALAEAGVELLKLEQSLAEKKLVMTEAQTAAARRQIEQNSLLKAGLTDYVDTNKKLAKSMEKLNEQFANVFQSAISGFISDLRQGMDAGEAFAKMLDRIIDGLINMALEMLFSKELLGGLFGVGGGGGGGGSILSALGLEKGGVVGQDGQKFRADPSWWAGAPSFATGGVVKPPGAIPILAHAGEVVVPRNQVKGLGQTNLTNNVGDIRIDMAQSGAVVSSTRDGAALGKQIQAAVQIVLVQESRPGGLLRKGA